MILDEMITENNYIQLHNITSVGNVRIDAINTSRVDVFGLEDNDPYHNIRYNGDNANIIAFESINFNNGFANISITAGQYVEIGEFNSLNVAQSNLCSKFFTGAGGFGKYIGITLTVIGILLVLFIISILVIVSKGGDGSVTDLNVDTITLLVMGVAGLVIAIIIAIIVVATTCTIVV